MSKNTEPTELDCALVDALDKIMGHFREDDKAEVLKLLDTKIARGLPRHGDLESGQADLRLTGHTSRYDSVHHVYEVSSLSDGIAKLHSIVVVGGPYCEDWNTYGINDLLINIEVGDIIVALRRLEVTKP